MNKYSNAVEPIVVPTPKEGREYLHTTTAGVKVPLLQAVTLGGTVFLFVLVIGIVFWWIDPLKPAVIAGGSVGLGWLVWALWRWSNLTKPDQPTVQVRSVDHDENPSTPRIVRVQLDKVMENGHIHQTKMFDLPATEEQLSILAAGLLEGGRPFSEAEWCGAGKPFSLNEFRALRGEMIRRGLLGLRNGKDARQGYALTEDGQAVMEQFLAPSPTEEEA